MFKELLKILVTFIIMYLIALKKIKLINKLNVPNESQKCKIINQNNRWKLKSRADSRLNIIMASAAAYHDAIMANYVRFKNFNIKDNFIENITVKGELTGKEIEIHSKVVISAIGSYTDQVKNYLSNNSNENMMAQSKGTHICLNADFWAS